MANKIYVASSWRNKYQEGVVKLLRDAGHEVYDFKEPVPGGKGFGWSQIDERWLEWSPAAFKEALNHPIAVKGYKNDKDAIDWCTMGVLVLPCGRSAHLEAGWIGGTGKPVAIYMPELPEPELMYRFFIEHAEKEHIPVAAICLTTDALLEFAKWEKPGMEIYARSECTFTYCPNPDTCKPRRGCILSVTEGSQR